MDALALLNVEKFLVFTLVLTRTSGVLIATPIFGSTQAPATVRALIALTLAVLIMPSQWFATLPYPGSLLIYVAVLAGELLIGLILGLGISILLGGMQMAGDMMSRVGGLTLADVFDPTTSTNVPLFSQLFSLLSTALFLIIGGHRLLLGGLLDTFSVIPPGGSGAMFLGTAGGGSGPGLLAPLVETILVSDHAEFSPGDPRRGPGDDGRAFGDAGAGPDQPHAAAIERDGGRLRPQRHDHLRRPVPVPRSGPAGLPGSDRADLAGPLRDPANPGALSVGWVKRSADPPINGPWWVFAALDATLLPTPFSLAP